MTSASIVPLPIASRTDISRIPRRGINEQKKVTGTGRWGLLRGIIVFIAIAAAITVMLDSTFLTTQLLHLGDPSMALRGPVQPPPPPPLGHGGIENDGLVWTTPKPGTARQIGWEDYWMMEWKRQQYSPNQKMGCRVTSDTLYAGRRVCFVPAYIPARLFVPEADSTRPKIPRVIFVTLKERRISPTTYASLLSVLHHNPEYELVLFDDDAVDRFVCSLEGDLSKKVVKVVFSKLRAGAMRADVWRLLILQRYGGVTLDSDVSAIARLPLKRGDTAVSSVGGQSHLPGGTGGLLEHRAMAFAPGHPFINEVVGIVKVNLIDPTYLLRNDTPEAEAEGSATMRLTGPTMYQKVLHDALMRAQCQKVKNSYVAALLEPEQHCDMEEFRNTFPTGLRLLQGSDLDGSLFHKVFHKCDLRTMEYDSNKVPLLEVRPEFCSNGAFERRAAERERLWKENVKKNQQGAEDENDLDTEKGELLCPSLYQKGGSNEHSPLIFARDNVVVCRTPKVGSTLLRHIFKSYTRRIKFKGEGFPGPDGPTLDTIHNMSEFNHYLYGYNVTRIMFVRHPVQRILSGFLQMYGDSPQAFWKWLSTMKDLSRYNSTCSKESTELSIHPVLQHVVPPQHCRCGIWDGAVHWKVYKIEEYTPGKVMRWHVPGPWIPIDDQQMYHSRRYEEKDYLTPDVLQILHNLTKDEMDSLDTNQLTQKVCE